MMSDVEADFRKHLFGPTSGGNDEVSQAEKLETVGAQKPQEPRQQVKGYRPTNQRLEQNRQAGRRRETYREHP